MQKIAENILAWLDPATIEPQALEQLHNIAGMPFIFKHLAVMPDCHLGRGATVGSVIATKEAIIPAAVGVDIGCGMIAVKTKFYAKDLPESLEATRKGIERRIPLGAGAFNQNFTESARQHWVALTSQGKGQYDDINTKWAMAIGTLGSGNHFIEISLDENDQVWLVLHSGSRGIGNQLATKHIKIAQKLIQNAPTEIKDPDLAYFLEHQKEFHDYIKDLLWAQEFATRNRDEMMDRVMTEMSYLFYKENGHQSEIELERINCHHNFTQQEEHFGEKVWLTRKGAIQMKKGQMGVIPGSMGTRSYIVSGLENTDAYHSAPHGAGRKHSRNAAKKLFTMADLELAMKGIEFNHKEAFIDEIPGAYKDIDLVMENSKELVEIKHTLRQLVNVKGD